MRAIRIHIGEKLENVLPDIDMQLLEFQSWGGGGATEELGEIHEFVIAFSLSGKVEIVKGRWFDRIEDIERYVIFNIYKFFVIRSSVGIFDNPDEAGEWIDFQIVNTSN